MRKVLSLAAGAAALLSMPLAAQALPMGAVDQGGGPQVTRVADFCGPGFHRGPLGACRPNAVVVRRPVTCRIVGLIPHRVCRVW